MGFNFKAKNEKNANNNQKTPKKGLKGAFSNFKTNVCDAMDSVSVRDGVCVGIGTGVGVAAAYGVKKYVDRKAAQAQTITFEEEVVERRTR